MFLSDAANQVIALTDAVANYWSAELPRRHPDYPLVHPGEDSGPPPPEEQQLRELLARLPEDMVYKLLLIADLGRGEVGPDDLAGHYEVLKDRFAKPEWAAERMVGMAPLADYLRDGLAEMGRAGIDVDNLTFAPAPSGT